MEERTSETQQAAPPAPPEVHHHTFVQPAAAPPLAAPLAGQPAYVKRAVALVIDEVGVGVVLAVLTFLPVIGPVVALAAFLGRDVLWDGNSPGKKLVGLRAVNGSGGRITPAESVLRNSTLSIWLVAAVLADLTFIGALLSIPVSIVGGLLALAEAYFVFTGQPRLGDRLAKTHVVDEQAQPAVVA
jgi:uncharacterized RDD family membrane protein YckC